MKIKSGYLVSKQFSELYRDYQNPLPKGISIYSVPNLNGNPENIEKHYHGIGRETLLPWLPIFDVPANNSDSSYIEKEAGFGLNVLEELGRAKDSFIHSLEDALQVYSLIAEKEKWEIIWAKILDEQNSPPDDSYLLGYEPSWFFGDHFSPICDTMFFPLWHGTDIAGEAFKSYHEILNEQGLFDTPENAQSFLEHYLSFEWAETGEYVIIEVRTMPIKENTNLSPEFARNIIQLLWSQAKGTKVVEKEKQGLRTQPSQLGKIEYNDEWDLTPPKKAAMDRLTELGVDITYTSGRSNFTLWIPGLPDELIPAIYVEIGYLMAQLGDENFPEKYKLLSDVPSKFFSRRSINPPVEFAEAYPGSMKYRVNPSKAE
ncbi:MAG: hypothetical protein GY796_32700 [Chloroflexi bacterium]|nr:hypothetical protein [Chloroflexota bacterium]